MSFTRIEELVVDFSTHPLDPKPNFDIGMEYENMGQTAAAVGFYLRAAEYGYGVDPELVYTALLRIHACMDSQKDREATARGVLYQAISYLPDRPEAYFLLSRFYERNTNWQNCYMFACMGLMHSRSRLKPLLHTVGYPGEYGLEFEKAVSGWWIGRASESVDLFVNILQTPGVDEVHKSACVANLGRMQA